MLLMSYCSRCTNNLLQTRLKTINFYTFYILQAWDPDKILNKHIMLLNEKH